MELNFRKLSQSLYAWAWIPVFLFGCSGTPGTAPGLTIQPVASFSRGALPEPLASQPGVPRSKNSIWSLVSSPNVILYPGLPDDTLYDVNGSSTDDVWTVGSACCVAHGSQEYSSSLIERWNGTSWSVVTPPSDEPADSQLRGVAAIATDNVWAVGYSIFPNQALIEHWNGKKWRVVSSPSLANSSLQAIVALSPKDIWAVGGANASPLTEHWDGKAWSVIPSGGQSGGASEFRSVAAVSSKDVWAVGEFDHPNANALVEHWNGTSWTQIALASKRRFASAFYGVTAVASNDVWAVGYAKASEKDQVPQTLIERWNGSRWRLTPSPNMEPKSGYRLTNWLFGVTASSRDDVWAVGLWTYYPGSGTTRSLFERWDGKVWKAEPGPAALESNNNLAFNQLFGITTIRPGLLWAVGTFFLDSQSEDGDTTLTVQTMHG